jgi:hypothetical protein
MRGPVHGRKIVWKNEARGCTFLFIPINNVYNFSEKSNYAKFGQVLEKLLTCTLQNLCR